MSLPTHLNILVRGETRRVTIDEDHGYTIAADGTPLHTVDWHFTDLDIEEHRALGLSADEWNDCNRQVVVALNASQDVRPGEKWL